MLLLAKSQYILTFKSHQSANSVMILFAPFPPFYLGVAVLSSTS